MIYPIQNRPLHKRLVNNPIPLPTTPIIRTSSNPRSLALSAATVRALMPQLQPLSLSLSLWAIITQHSHGDSDSPTAHPGARWVPTNHVHSVFAAGDNFKLSRLSFLGFLRYWTCLMGLWCFGDVVFSVRFVSVRYDDGDDDEQNMLCASGSISVRYNNGICIRFIFNKALNLMHALCWCSKQRSVFSLFRPYFTLQKILQLLCVQNWIWSWAVLYT